MDLIRVIVKVGSSQYLIHFQGLELELGSGENLIVSVTGMVRLVLG